MFWSLLALALLGAAIAFYEVPRLLLKQSWGELIVFSVLLAIGLALSAAMILGLPVPNPTRGIELVFAPLTRLLYPR